ncbi:hypothetical protein LX36DRAFT_674648 [Colletotrichum falcatum]|nr:hypothetical protein LX36DRAFT_674648 [Colletotrichum falcatum]
MMLLQLLIRCTAALAVAVPAVAVPAVAAPAVAAPAFANPLPHDPSAASLRVRDSGDVDAHGHGPSLARLLSRDSSEAYTEAARAAGGSLRSGTYYYFMNCAQGPSDGDPGVYWPYNGCSHVGLVVGKTGSLGKKSFKATYIHIRLWNTGFDQSQHEYTPYDRQHLVYGGTTTSSKANVPRYLASLFYLIMTSQGGFVLAK